MCSRHSKCAAKVYYDSLAVHLHLFFLTMYSSKLKTDSLFFYSFFLSTCGHLLLQGEEETKAEDGKHTNGSKKGEIIIHIGVCLL